MWKNNATKDSNQKVWTFKKKTLNAVQAKNISSRTVVIHRCLPSGSDFRIKCEENLENYENPRSKSRSGSWQRLLAGDKSKVNRTAEVIRRAKLDVQFAPLMDLCHIKPNWRANSESLQEEWY